MVMASVDQKHSFRSQRAILMKGYGAHSECTMPTMPLYDALFSARGCFESWEFHIWQNNSNGYPVSQFKLRPYAQQFIRVLRWLG